MIPFLLLLQLWATGTRLPVFDDYPTKEIFIGKPARVDLRSESDAPRFRTRLTQDAAKGPNFAGSFTVVMWHCGSNCQTVAMVNAKTAASIFHFLLLRAMERVFEGTAIF